ncbi:MAG: TIGR04211 family SH3 domain-containing protein [Acidiferrobacterales bacterium]
MRKYTIASIAWLLALSPITGFADKVYVTDQFQIPMHAAQGSDAPVVKNLVTGTPLDLLEQVGNQVHVRDAQGTDGWVDIAAITRDPPARAQLDALRAQQAALKTQLNKTQAALAQETAQAGKLTSKLKAQSAAPAAPPPAVMPTPPAPAPPPVVSPHDNGDAPLVVAAWAAVSFAMLIIGFFAGVMWLREVNRRKLGGMYLRI